MEARHTPGPWGVKTSESGQSAIFSGENGQWVATTTIKFPKSTDKANARLLAASPDLLESLQRIEKVAGEYNPKFPMGAGMFAEFSEAMGKARAAIAKATGGEQ